jgi:NAD(P)-dependent dehydrogenase (short-subunit alcohol dehydrogenase family)
METARMLASVGAEVCLTARRGDLLASNADEIGGGTWSHTCDVADPGSVAKLAAEVESRWGAVDGLVNNAGVAPMARLDETSNELWEQTFAINVRGPFLLCRELGPLLHESESSAVVNVSSTLAERAIPGMVAYNASKAALNQLTKSLALEWAPEVRVNAIMPAVVDTPIHELRGMTPDQVQSMSEFHPMQRVGKPEDIAHMITYLLSDAASWITGTIIPVDGGVLAG